MQKVMVKRKVTLEMTVMCHCQEYDDADRSLPLADKPHLLQPNATKRDLFGGSQTTIEAWPKCGIEIPAHMQPIAQPLCVPPPADHNRPPESSTAEALPNPTLAASSTTHVGYVRVVLKWLPQWPNFTLRASQGSLL